MNKIITPEQCIELGNTLHEQNKRIVLAGGCFDLLHIGHIIFIEEARKHGDYLILMLESDETITKSKGNKRPINSQDDRAKILSALTNVDYIIKLNPDMTNKSYDDLVFILKPAIIATTKGDINKHYKERQAEIIGAKVIDVTTPISDKSTTKLVEILDEL